MPGRSFDALQRSLAKGEVQPVYYFFGEEELLKDEAVRRITELAVDAATRDFNLDRRRAPELSADQFRSLVETPPMLAARRCVVVSEVECLQQKRARQQALRGAVLAYVGRPLPETVLVLVQSAGTPPDAGLEQAGAGVDFEVLEPGRVLKWIHHHAKQSGITFEEDAARHLQEAVGDDLAQLAAEVAKLSGAAQGRAVTVADVTALVGVRHGETAADFVGAVTARRFTDAAAMVPQLLASPGTSGVRLVSALGTALVGLSLARSHLDAGDSSAATRDRVFRAIQAARPFGLRNWGDEAAAWVREAARWSAEELDAGLAALLKADARLKSTALSDEESVVAEVVLSLGVAAGAVA
ncbi:MAG TPA: DNA polymerase III subunit delta [Gemmatimonadales bacterium]|nr:DNA polymerase III subunit delta [Gemmatimonadales bacterium]